MVYEIQLIVCIVFIISDISSKLGLKKCLLFFIETALTQSFFISKCRWVGINRNVERGSGDVLEMLCYGGDNREGTAIVNALSIKGK